MSSISRKRPQSSALELVTDSEAAPDRGQSGGPDERTIQKLIARFNALYMVVNEGGKALIFTPQFDQALNRRRYDRLRPGDLRMLYANERVQVGVNKDDSPVMKGVADVWLQHPDRRQFIHGVTFDPTNQARPGVLNLWQGYAVQPRPGDWSLMRAHMLDVICAGNQEHFEYLIRWLARLFQHPAEQGEVAIVMKGGEGTGKGTLAKAVKHIIGHHAIAISTAKHLIGNFNAHLRDALFLFADEAFFGKRRLIATFRSGFRVVRGFLWPGGDGVGGERALSRANFRAT